MKVLYALAAFAACVVVAPSGAAPIAGGEYLTQVWQNAPAYIDSTSACPAFHPAPAPQQTGLTAITRGWYGTPFESGGALFQQVQLTADVNGTIIDTAGNTYLAAGHFADTSVHNLFFQHDLLFNGSGEFVAAGPTGVIRGEATFRLVTGPPEFQVTFTRVTACDVR